MSAAGDRLIERLLAQAALRPAAPALQDRDQTWDYAGLTAQLARTAAWLKSHTLESVGLYADNGADWIVCDLALLRAGRTCVPLPLFFSPSQLAHAVEDAGLDAVICAHPDKLATLLPGRVRACEPIPGGRLHLCRLDATPRRRLPTGTLKLTYTSGSTGSPKGVCLDAAAMNAVSESLLAASGARSDDRHLCVMPLSTLLENLAGVYVPLMAGATVIAPPTTELGLRGAAGLDAETLLRALRRARPSSLILVPQLLRALVLAAEAGAALPASLRFVAVGGAPVPPALLARAAALGVPVFEGYGLSECASVVALNRPGAARAGSVGRPLPHVRVTIAADGEILVAGHGFLGYAGEAPRAPDAPLATGDLGHLDADGYLHVTGRKKHLIVTSFGRKLSPEWVEAALELEPAIAQAAVFGDARPFNVAIIVARDIAAVEAGLRRANRGLPDYARIRAWIAAREPFTPGNGQLTANGRTRRADIGRAYAEAIECCYRSGTPSRPEIPNP